MKAYACRQQGVVLLLLALCLALLGSSALLLDAGLGHGKDTKRGDAVAAGALAAARDALLGYAAAYPDRAGVNNPNAGPGLLPCPDTRLDANDVAGQADSPCALSSGTETGLLPWRTLDLPELRDGAGAPIWYALANEYRNNPAGVVNSDAPAALRLDTCRPESRALAALLIAPGPALVGQQRNPRPANARYPTGDFLEGANASRGDGCFGSALGAGSNDRVLVIDRATLNAVMEQRVLADLQRALQRYFADPDGDDVAGRDPECVAAGLASDCDDAWPWPGPWAPPAGANFVGVPRTTVGQLPLRRVGVGFAAPYVAGWSLAGGELTASGIAPPEANCLRETTQACLVQPRGFRLPAVLSRPPVALTGRCVWPGGPALNCAQTYRIADPGGSGFVLLRKEIVNLVGLPRRLLPPDAGRPRRESTSLGAVRMPAASSVTLSMADSLLSPSGLIEGLGETTLVLVAGALVAHFELAEVPLDLEVDDDGKIDPGRRRSPGELPAWFTANRWQDFALFAFADSQGAGLVRAACVAAGDCLRISRADPAGRALPVGQVGAVVLLAGAALVGQQRSSGGIDAWFERENASLGQQFREQPPLGTFNDRLRRLDLDD